MTDLSPTIATIIDRWLSFRAKLTALGGRSLTKINHLSVDRFRTS